MSEFEQALLPDAEKQRLCRRLLEEFGVGQIQVRGDEMIHGCVLPFGQHSNQAKEPTASLNWKKLTYRCLGTCDAGGGLLWFIATCRGTNVNDARKWLDRETGFGPDDMPLSTLLAYFDAIYNPERVERPPIPHMDASILAPYCKIHPYLTEIRGIPEKNIIRHQVGYGIFRCWLGGEKWVESERILIPHFWKGDLTGWQTRRLIKDGTAKYLASPDLPKDRTIYSAAEGKEVIVVESPMSVVAKSHVCPTMSATFGAGLTDHQIRLLGRYRKVVLFFDSDLAGWIATEKVAEALQNYSDVWVADNPWNEDAGGLPDEETLKALDGAIPWSLWSRPDEVRVWEAA
jgi:5S rRNA maturation endonuclease (ribonuclease M5)